MNKKLKEKTEQFFKKIENMSQDELYKMFMECGTEGLTKVKDKKEAGVFCTDDKKIDSNFKFKITNTNKAFLNFNKININDTLVKAEHFKIA